MITTIFAALSTDRYQETGERRIGVPAHSQGEDGRRKEIIDRGQPSFEIM
jgi:hypothetical protein